MTKNVFTTEIAHANIAADSASELLNAMRGAAATADEARIALCMAVYRFQNTGAWWVIDTYSGRADGFVQAVSDAVNGPCRPSETSDDYKKRWQGFRSSAYDLAKAGYLATFLSDNEWGTDFAARPYHLAIIAKIVGHEAMKGDAELTCSTASNLLERVSSGELVNASKLRAEVDRMLGKVASQSDSQVRTLMVSAKVLDIDDTTAADIKRMTESYMLSLVAMAKGRKA